MSNATIPHEIQKLSQAMAHQIVQLPPDLPPALKEQTLAAALSTVLLTLFGKTTPLGLKASFEIFRLRDQLATATARANKWESKYRQVEEISLRQAAGEERKLKIG
jgi:hypothetical protein